MSCYEKNKVIRLPFPIELCEKANAEEPFDCEDYLSDLLGNDWYWNGNTSTGFDIVVTEIRTYLDYILLRTRNEDVGEYGMSFYLSEDDIKLYKPLFDKLGVEYDVNDLRKVVYCYYNCCEPVDYYDATLDIFDSI